MWINKYKADAEELKAVGLTYGGIAAFIEEFVSSGEGQAKEWERKFARLRIEGGSDWLVKWSKLRVDRSKESEDKQNNTVRGKLNYSTPIQRQTEDSDTITKDA